MSSSTGVQVGRICPGCGREESVPIVRGLPSASLFELAERGQVSLGGCMVTPGGDPDFACRACGLKWGRADDPTADEQALAELQGVGWPDVVRVLGTGWRGDCAASGDGVQWFVSGEPAQVAIGVDGASFVLARPLTEWGQARLDVQPDGGRRFLCADLLSFPQDIVAAAEVIASRRRRSFRWCRTCRRVHAPETFAGEGMCQDCAAAFERPWS